MANPYHAGFGMNSTGLSEDRNPFGMSSSGNMPKAGVRSNSNAKQSMKSSG
jgi:hypothetical protein